MKDKSKVKNVAAGAIFIFLAVNEIAGFIAQATTRWWFDIWHIGLMYGFRWTRIIPLRSSVMVSGLYIVVKCCGIALLVIMGIFALQQKKRSRTLNSLGVVYMICVVVNILLTLQYRKLGSIPHAGIYATYRFIAFSALILPVLMMIAFVLSYKASSEAALDTEDMEGQKAGIHTLSPKQKALYDEHLRDGIITQEEYNQIMSQELSR